MSVEFSFKIRHPKTDTAHFALRTRHSCPTIRESSPHQCEAKPEICNLVLGIPPLQGAGPRARLSSLDIGGGRLQPRAEIPDRRFGNGALGQGTRKILVSAEGTASFPESISNQRKRRRSRERSRGVPKHHSLGFEICCLGFPPSRRQGQRPGFRPPT